MFDDFFVGFCFTLILAIAVLMATSLYHDSECLSAGYTDARTGLFLDGYCMKENEAGVTESVPVEDI